MRFSLVMLCLLLIMNVVSSLKEDTYRYLTVNIESGTRECFYEIFAKGQVIDVDYQVISGGQGKLDISFRLLSPTGIVLASDIKEPDNTHSVRVPETGEYTFCWDNTYSRFNTKTVFFEIGADGLNEENDQQNTGSNSATTGWLSSEMAYLDIEASIERVHKSLVKIRQMQEMQRAVEARDRMLAENNFFYVNVWAQAQIILMLAVGFVQVVVVRNLFETNPYPKK